MSELLWTVAAFLLALTMIIVAATALAIGLAEAISRYLDYSTERDTRRRRNRANSD